MINLSHPPVGAAQRRSKGASALAPELLSDIEACLFDLDGVITQTAKVHAAAWKQMFDAFLRQRAKASVEPFEPFEVATD